jgi:hypothetical protein
MNKFLSLIILPIVFCACSKLFYATDDDIKLFSPNIQNGNISPNYFIIPIEDKNFLCKILESEVNKISTLDFSLNAKYYVDQENYIVCLDIYNKEIIVAKINSDDEITNERRIKYPKIISPQSIFKHKDLIFLGGINYTGKKTFLVYNIISSSWNEVEIPISGIMAKKSIEDILIQNDTLIAVDNIVLPKFLLKYDVSDINNIKFIKSEELIFARVNEGIVKSVIQDKIIFTLSGSGGPGPDFDKCISAYKFGHKIKGFELINTVENYLSYDNWKDFVVHENKIYVAGLKYVKVLAIKDKYFKAKNNSNLPWFDNQVNNAMLKNFHTIYSGIIIGLRYLPENNNLILVIKKNRRYSYEILNI